MAQTRVALIGTGGIAQSHVRGWLAQPDAELAVLCDVRPEAAEATRDRHGLSDARIVTRLEDALASDCDAVDLCTPSGLHATQVIASLRAGKHVLCEKPMADTLEEAREIAAVCRAHPRQVYLCEHRYLFDPLVIAVRNTLPEIGVPHWYRQRSAHANDLSPHIKAMGAFLDMGYHPLYTALHFMGPATAVFGSANLTRAGCAHVGLHFMGPATAVFGLKQSFARPELADDSSVVVLEHPRGASVIEASFSAIGPFGGTRPLEVYGARGTLIGNWIPRAHLTLYRGEQGGDRSAPGEEITIPGGSWIANAIRHFLDCIAGTTRPIAGWAEALETMRAYAAALRSARSGRKEPVEA